MDRKELLDERTMKCWDAAFGELLALIPKGKKAQAFARACYCETVAKQWFAVAAESTEE